MNIREFTVSSDKVFGSFDGFPDEFVIIVYEYNAKDDYGPLEAHLGQSRIDFLNFIPNTGKVWWTIMELISEDVLSREQDRVDQEWEDKFHRVFVAPEM